MYSGSTRAVNIKLMTYIRTSFHQKLGDRFFHEFSFEVHKYKSDSTTKASSSTLELFKRDRVMILK